jgi:hypothetical protein
MLFDYLQIACHPVGQQIFVACQTFVGASASVQHKFVGVVSVGGSFSFGQELGIGLLPEIGMDVGRE